MILSLLKNTEKPQETTTHRIVGVEYQGNNIFFATQGDANGSPDLTKTILSQIVGKVIFKIPYFGYVVAFSRTLPGVVILIIIPATIIVYDEINKIKEEIKKRKKKAKPVKIGSPDSK